MSSTYNSTLRGDHILYNVDPYEVKPEKVNSSHERDVEIFEATNFLMAIFTGEEAESILENASIERRLAYYLIEVFAAVDLHRGSLRYAPIRVAKHSSSQYNHNNTINSPSTTVLSDVSVNENDSLSPTPSKRSIYPIHPLEVRKFLFLQQVSLFPWHFPLSRITLPTHIGMQLLGETSKGDTIQIFCLLPLRESSLFINALSVAFPTQFQDYLHFSHLKEPISSHIFPLPLIHPVHKKDNPLKRLTKRHSQCITPLWQRECVKVSFFSLRTSSWTNWQWCTLQIRDVYLQSIHSDNKKPLLNCSKLVIKKPHVPQHTNKNNNLKDETVRDRTDSFAYFNLQDASVFAGHTITYYLHDVTISLAEIATPKRRKSYLESQNSACDNNNHSNSYYHNSINRRLFPKNDDETAEEDNSVVIRVKCQQEKPSQSSLGRFVSSNDTEVREEDLEDIQIHIELPTQEILLEFSLALASTCGNNNSKLSNSFNSFNYHYKENEHISQPLHFAKEYLEKLQKDATQHTKYRIQRQPFLDAETPSNLNHNPKNDTNTTTNNGVNGYLNNTEKQWKLFEKLRGKAMVEVEAAFHSEYITNDNVDTNYIRSYSYDNSTTL